MYFQLLLIGSDVRFNEVIKINQAAVTIKDIIFAVAVAQLKELPTHGQVKRRHHRQMHRNRHSRRDDRYRSGEI